MAFNREQFKTIKGIFLTANDLDYQANFLYNKTEEDKVSYTVELFSSTNTKQEHSFIWSEPNQIWQCKHPEQLSIQLLKAITEKIEQIEQIK